MEIATQIVGQALFFLYQLFGDSLGWSIIFFTLILRSLLLPLTIPSLRAADRMKKIQPELNKLKKKHKGDNKRIQALRRWSCIKNTTLIPSPAVYHN